MATTVLIEWSEKLSTGINKIDNQHKHFIGLINSTNALVESKKKKELNAQIPELLNYARTHFSTEEEIFDKYNYPYSSEHKLEHLKLIEKAISFYDRSKANEEIGRAHV